MWLIICLVVCILPLHVQPVCRRSKTSFVCKGSLSIDQFSIENSDKILKFSLKNPDISFSDVDQMVNIGSLFPNLTRLSIPLRLCQKFCSNFNISQTGVCENIVKCKEIVKNRIYQPILLLYRHG